MRQPCCPPGLRHSHAKIAHPFHLALRLPQDADFARMKEQLAIAFAADRRTGATRPAEGAHVGLGAALEGLRLGARCGAGGVRWRGHVCAFARRSGELRLFTCCVVVVLLPPRSDPMQQREESLRRLGENLASLDRARGQTPRAHYSGTGSSGNGTFR